ncbi:ROK family transcriptional regulator [Aeromicrobium ginsengisoli]|uniref:ROK family transcriptional regulator n=1 Tax=Aeromicrobium ginsengisoli TaxID=363867 RepID=A0A5M4FHB9_9ACTN|nr:ROK family transcriptional regulator [Aeromicrobium ginsengisoli]KAA1399574.1 ROK family transcriptional regulator [Aeromicrobium ginsengisoli]
MSLTGVPTGTEYVRRQNTGLVLRALRAHGPATRTELARRTGLAKATVGTIVAELEAARAVTQDDDSVSSGRGRPGRPVALTGESILGLGLEVNVDYVAAVALDLGGNVRVVETRPVATAGTPPSTEELIELATDVRTALMADGHTVVGATVAVPGLVAHDNRTVSWAPNLGWDGRHLAAELEEAFGADCPTTIDNDANCAALAEAAHGVTTDVSHSLYITGTIGIGAGIVQDGRLVRGGAGFAGEVGHMPIGNPSRVCGCGRMGCWEASVGLRAMLSTVGIDEEDTPLQTALAVADLAARDASTRAALATLGHELGTGLATLAAVLDPAAIVLGGYFVPLGAYVVPAAGQVLAERLPSASIHLPQIRLSSLGIHAAALGAAEDALADVYAGTLAL